MKKFFKDYKDLCKHSGRFYKDHWLGTLIVTAIGAGLCFTPLAVYEIKSRRELKKLEESYIKECNKAEEDMNS